MTDQLIIDSAYAFSGVYSDYKTGISTVPGYSIPDGGIYDDSTALTGPNLGLGMVVYVSADKTTALVTFVGTEDGKDAAADLGLAQEQFSSNQTNIQDTINTVLSNPQYANVQNVIFDGHSAGGIHVQYASQQFATAYALQGYSVGLVTNNAPAIFSEEKRAQRHCSCPAPAQAELPLNSQMILMSFLRCHILPG